MAPRILFLHGLRGRPGSERHVQLERLYGADNVICPDLRTHRTIWIAIGGLCIFNLLLAGAVIGAFLNLPLAGGISVLVCSAVGGGLAEILLLRGTLSIMLARGLRIATAAYDKDRPNLIVAKGFGAVIGRRIPRPKPPMVLFEPALEKYAKWTSDRSHKRMELYPYLLIVHESKNKFVNVNDSFRTIERADPGRSRLEVLETSPTHPRIEDSEMKLYIDEAFTNGKAAVEVMKDEAAAHEIIDASQFGSIVV